MAWIDDIDVLNNAATDANWTADQYDTPTLNDAAATTPIFLEGSACMWWPLKKGITGGYTYTNVITGTPTLTGRVCVGFINYPFADIDAIPITALSMRLSSATTFTTNYLEWNARAQILSPENVPISGHTPVIGYEDDGTETGTFNGNAESVGWVATTGNNADGKQGGFDWFFLIGWVGAHSATLNETFFSGLYSEYFDNGGNGLPGETSRPIGVLSQAGEFFQTNVSFQLGDGSSDTADLNVTEIGKTVFFNNLHINHELGYQFVDPNSTWEIDFIITDCVHFWNDQSISAEIFTNANNATVFKVTSCAFSNGGQSVLPSYSADRWVKTSKFSACGIIDIGDCIFEDNIVSNTSAGFVGVLYDGNTDTRRAKRTNYENLGIAIEFNTAGTYTLDGDTFVGNTFDIENSSNSTLVDSYPTSNRNTDQTIRDGLDTRAAQTFVASAGTLTLAQFYLSKIGGSLTGDVVVKLYATSGGAPTGAPLATSEGYDANSLGPSPAVIDFEFHDPYTLVASTTYAISVEYENGDASNWVKVGMDSTSPTHSGTGYTWTSSWTSSANDFIFYVYRDGLVTLNLTNGSNPSENKINNTGSPRGITVFVNAVDVTLSGMKDNTEVRVCDQSDPPLQLAGIENATAGTTDDRSFTFTLQAGTLVDIVIFNVEYRLPPNNRIDDFTIPSTATTIPISQIPDRNYSNP